MAYRLNPSMPLIETVRAVADGEIAKADKSLAKAKADPQEAVHDMRKRMKKVRALLRLVRPGMEKTYKRENEAFRDVARGLSDTRDAQVLSQTVSDLATDEAARDLIEPVSLWATKRHSALLENEDLFEEIEAARMALREARRRVESWTFKNDREAVESMQRGLSKTYRRAHDDLREALVGADAEALHEWRKRVKYHWYHCRLLRDAWPEAMDVRIGALKAVADDLGKDHDIAVLIETLRSEARDEVPPALLDAVEKLAAEKASHLRRRALMAAPRLFVEKPKAISKRLAGYWTFSAAQHAGGFEG